MNKRQVQKQKTRRLILQKAKEIFIDQGFLNTSTAQIATASEIAHGTLFLHFKSKDMLIIEILDQQLEQISKKIMELIRDTIGLEEILGKYLDFLEEEEDFFSVLARELPFYPEQLRRKIISYWLPICTIISCAVDFPTNHKTISVHSNIYIMK